ncbi:hypothetical protein MTP06_36230 [Streptomyces sp. PLM4]|uniref:Uncharacterized protein n=1 Tax=Streptomyces albidoflavus TaxID=1886 RepID=A0AA37FBW2_9ACTN|nr:hypothetical protein SFR_2949 [Streptomyces sp. FR-008]BDH70174.1 hypothetical protein MTP06_36230 [Streptomyces sp. PLM4]GHI46521.1 hypothetical protein ScoT_26950 [Streptomyces albidoflavus]
MGDPYSDRRFRRPPLPVPLTGNTMSNVSIMGNADISDQYVPHAAR